MTDLTPKQQRVYDYLRRNPGETRRRIGDELGMTGESTRDALMRLQAKGLVRRSHLRGEGTRNLRWLPT
jgi:DNA-binding MarR family transcriptional regulator